MYRKLYIFHVLDLSMKIREVLDKKVRDKIYNRYILILPKDVVQDSKLLGIELRAKSQNGKIVIEKEN